MNNLATIRKIKNLVQAANSDSLEIATLEGLGWQVVVKAGLHQIGDFVVFIQSDTVVPANDKFAFLEKQNYRIKNIKLRGNYSYGLILPLLDIADSVNLDHVRENGFDVTDILGIKKYEKPVNLASGEAIGSFPSHIIPKTDEENFENFPQLISVFKQHEIYACVKHDGCLDGDTIISTDKGDMAISDIAQKQNCDIKVFSLNHETNEYEFCQILEKWEKNDIGDWYEIELEDGTKIKLTGNHKVYLPELSCYREVENLRKNDILLKN